MGVLCCTPRVRSRAQPAEPVCKSTKKSRRRGAGARLSCVQLLRRLWHVCPRPVFLPNREGGVQLSQAHTQTQPHTPATHNSFSGTKSAHTRVHSHKAVESTPRGGVHSACPAYGRPPLPFPRRVSPPLFGSLCALVKPPGQSFCSPCGLAVRPQGGRT